MRRYLKSIDSNELFLDQDKLMIEIDGMDIGTEKDLYKCFKNKIQFPDYFGENWDAFWDIISDNDFVNSDVQIIVKNYNTLLTYRKDKQIFLGILIDWLNCDYIKYNIEIFIIK